MLLHIIIKKQCERVSTRQKKEGTPEKVFPDTFFSWY